VGAQVHFEPDRNQRAGRSVAAALNPEPEFPQ